MSTARLWLFRFLIIIGIAALIASWFLPWWSTHIKDLPGLQWALSIHPYGLDASKMYEVLTIMPEGGHEADMPVWFTEAMWTYFGLVIVLLFIAFWFQNKQITLLGKKLSLNRFLLLGVGLSYILVCVAFLLVASMRLEAIGMPLTGEVFISMGNYAVWQLETTANSVLRFGFWLAVPVGPFLILLTLLRNKIVGNQTIS